MNVLNMQGVTETLRQHGCSENAFCGLIDISAALWSMCRRGLRPVTWATEARIQDGLRDVIALAKASPAPVDWSRVPEVKEAIRRLRVAEASHAASSGH
jgi:hypothetical protein